MARSVQISDYFSVEHKPDFFKFYYLSLFVGNRQILKFGDFANMP